MKKILSFHLQSRLNISCWKFFKSEISPTEKSFFLRFS